MVPPKQSRIPRHDARAAPRNRPRSVSAVDAVVRRPYIHSPPGLRKLFLLCLVETKMNYRPKPGLNVPIITVLDDSGRVIADAERQRIMEIEVAEVRRINADRIADCGLRTADRGENSRPENRSLRLEN